MYWTNMKDKIVEASNSDQQYLKIKETLQQGNFHQKFIFYELKEDEILMYKGKVYVPNSHVLKNVVSKEINNVTYIGHLGY
jgi:hypothetical protein